jgi:hypothetical protein
VNFGFVLRASAAAAFLAKVSRRCFFLMVQATQIMHLFDQRDRFMPSKTESEESIDCLSEPSVCVYEICE